MQLLVSIITVADDVTLFASYGSAQQHVSVVDSVYHLRCSFPLGCFVGALEGSKNGFVLLFGDMMCHWGWSPCLPVNPDSNGNREVICCHSFRIPEGSVRFQAVWPLLAGVRPNDPNLAPPFVDPRKALENENGEGF